MNPPYLALVGPTASGKTDLALELAARQNAEIISVDSRQIYQSLRIGTAKPEGTWTADGAYNVQGIRMHLVDCWPPTDPFSVADFIRLAQKAVSAATAAGKAVLFVGGTGLYFKAFEEGLAALPPRDEALRERLRLQAERDGRSALHQELQRVDPVSAGKIPANNIARLIRALEVFQLSGKPLSVWHAEHAQTQKGRPPVFRMIGLAIDSVKLYRRIETRCRWMLDNGMVEETAELLKKGIAPESPALSSVGYPQVLSFLRSEISREALLDLLILKTRQYAKRQMTWFRNQAQPIWMSPKEVQGL